MVKERTEAMKLEQLIKHPERMDRDTLYNLRSMLALYPYFQTARLLMLKTCTYCTTRRSTRS